jgi:hypothetical protein
MDLELACIVCNWSRDLWWSLGLGAVGAAAAAAAAASAAYSDDWLYDVFGPPAARGGGPPDPYALRYSCWFATYPICVPSGEIAVA